MLSRAFRALSAKPTLHNEMLVSRKMRDYRAFPWSRDLRGPHDVGLCRSGAGSADVSATAALNEAAGVVPSAECR